MTQPGVTIDKWSCGVKTNTSDHVHNRKQRIWLLDVNAQWMIWYNDSL